MLPSPPLSKGRKYCDARRLCVCVCASTEPRSLGGEGNALYPVLSGYWVLRLRISYTLTPASIYNGGSGSFASILKHGTALNNK